MAPSLARMAGRAIQSLPVGITSSAVTAISTVRALSRPGLAAMAAADNAMQIAPISKARLVRVKSTGTLSLKQVQDVGPRTVSDHRYRARRIADLARK